MIDTIIFDADGVILDSEKLWDVGQTQWLQRHGLTYDRATIKPLLTGRSLRDGTQAVKELLGLTPPLEVLMDERLALMDEMLRTQVEFMDGFLAFFETIRGRYKTCIASGMGVAAFDAVNSRLNLTALFGEHIYLSPQLGLPSKPAPDLFLHAARALASLTPHCVVIEDAPFGLEAAHAAGMIGIGLTSTYPADMLDAATHIVSHFADIPPLLEQLAQAPKL